jgi:type II secretory pathway component PulK
MSLLRHRVTSSSPRLFRERERRDRGGVALLLVIAAVMVLTVLVTDMRFGSRVRYLQAVHGRDEVVATGLAHSGLAFFRLILLASQQLQGNQMITTLLQGKTLVEILSTIDTGLLRMMFASDGDPSEEDVETYKQTGQVSEEVRAEASEETNRFGKKGFLDFDGDFSAHVEGEDCKINLNMFSTHATGQAIQDMAAAQVVYRLLTGTEEDEAWLRDRNIDAWDLIGNIVDWVDADGSVSTGKGGYEDDLYNRLSSPYLSKNAPFDTPEELRLVAGWQDEVYDRYADKLTIYGSQKININCADRAVIAAMLQANSPRLLTQTDLERIFEELDNYRAATSFQRPADVTAWFKNQLPDLAAAFTNGISTRTKVYTITSTGTVGDTAVTLTAVLNYDSSTGSKDGKFMYWRIQ